MVHKHSIRLSSSSIDQFSIVADVSFLSDILGTTDFIDQTDGTIVFRTCERERQKVVLQLGTSDADRALTASKML